MNKASISAVIICLNEQSNIERCLKSLNWVDEVIVYDSGSTDKTIDIAQQYGAKVVQGDWLGFGPSKHKATSLAQNDWILSVDADEEIPQALQAEILSSMRNLSPEIAYRIPRLSYFMSQWIRRGGWFPDYQLRLFNKKNYQWNQEPIHEKVESIHQTQDLVQVHNLNNYFHHYVFKNIDHQVATNNKYSTLQAQKMFTEKKCFSYFHMLTKPYVKFIECYFLKLGLLDGWAGYVIARNAAYSVFMKWVKLKELYDQKK